MQTEIGYPIMITPHSQFVVTQSAINVAMGERYKHVTDELIVSAQGVYGEDSGYPWMDQNLKDKLLGPPRQYFNTAMPLLTLIQELGKQMSVRYVRVQRSSDSLVIQNQSLG